MQAKGRKMMVWTVGIVASVIGLWAGYTQLYEGRLGQPEYRVVEREGDIEFREYEPFIIASTEPSASGQNGLNRGFRVLAGYIFGGNEPGEKLAMTAPVLQQDAPQSSDGMVMAFVMPAGRTIDNLPLPNDAAVSLATVDWGEVAAVRFSGRGKQNRFQQAESRLMEAIAAAGRVSAGPALYAQYNSPSAFPPLRRNEVLVPLQTQ